MPGLIGSERRRPTTKKLDPCPFCGKVPKGEWKQGQALPHLIVRHKEPSDCALEMSIIFAKDEDAAIEKWNRRVGDG